MKGEDEKLKPPEARVGVCAGVHTRVRARRVHKLSTRAERADGEDVDAHRLNRVRVRDFCSAVALCCPLLSEQTCCAGNGFSVAEGTCGVRRRAKGGAVGWDQWHPVIQIAPRTANKRPGEL